MQGFPEKQCTDYENNPSQSSLIPHGKCVLVSVSVACILLFFSLFTCVQYDF